MILTWILTPGRKKNQKGTNPCSNTYCTCDVNRTCITITYVKVPDGGDMDCYQATCSISEALLFTSLLLLFLLESSWQVDAFSHTAVCCDNVTVQRNIKSAPRSGNGCRGVAGSSSSSSGKKKKNVSMSALNVTLAWSCIHKKGYSSQLSIWGVIQWL